MFLQQKLLDMCVCVLEYLCIEYVRICVSRCVYMCVVCMCVCAFMCVFSFFLRDGGNQQKARNIQHKITNLFLYRKLHFSILASAFCSANYFAS